ALNLEYTLPGISQSVVITRMEGRTLVPEREKIASFASHGATMVIFLSTGLLKELSRELIRGGYQETTPAAIVYKATWPEEKAVVCQVGTLYETALREQITKTALILVGEAVAHRGYERSKLYAPDFTTAFRKGTDAAPKVGDAETEVSGGENGGAKLAEPETGGKEAE
ncbi:precorrin-4 C(11)-methyltransferase, partial [gut metagenome]